MKRGRALMRVVVLAGAWTSSSCAPSGFADETLVATVRILASSAEPAYAQPGSTVSLQVLAFDGRPAQPEPMSIFWIPFVCEDPTDDAYYACFQQLEGADGGAPDGGEADSGAPGIGALRPGVDLTPFLPSGPSYKFKMPSDVVTRHTPVPGQPGPLRPGYPLQCRPARVTSSFCRPTRQRQPPAGADRLLRSERESARRRRLGSRLHPRLRLRADGGPDGGPITNANPVSRRST